MAKQYGLIVPGKEKGQILSKPSIFNEDSDEDTAVVKPTGITKRIKKQDQITQKRAIEEDPTVYQYDEIYDEMDSKRKESKLSRKDLDKKPKYISRLLAAAEKRKRDNERRIERQVQKEREAEGEEFKDKESFVTSAYKKKLEEMKELEELEKREEYLESIGDVTKQGNLDGFYRHLYDQKVNYTSKEMSGSRSESKPDEKSAKKRKYRKRDDSQGENDENHQNESIEEVTIKKEHLPSNLDADSDFSIDSSDSDDEKIDENPPKTSTESVKVETDVPKTEEPKVEEPQVAEVIDCPPKIPKIDIWKKRTVGDVYDEAVRRYFERKSSRDL